ncbi:MAG: aldehyde dehydrogenase family protein, partial [Serpentinimonas sp.]|nr:aldehyde dehydrogenase family protein [Serpentinimonas sp.]
MPALENLQSLLPNLLQRLGVHQDLTGGDLEVHSPIDGALLARLVPDTPASAQHKIGLAQAAFQQWRQVPPPVRGELIRLFGEELRAAKAD